MKKGAKKDAIKLELDPEIISACDAYKKAMEAVTTSVEHTEHASWARAAAAVAIRDACVKHNQKYLDIATANCDVSRQAISMDVKAEDMRKSLGRKADDLPPNSLSAFYELHRGAEAARVLADGDEEARKVAEKKIRDAGKSIARGAASLRAIRKMFASELKSARARKNSGKSPTQSEVVIAKPPVIESLDLDGLKQMVETVTVPSGRAVPVITITPTDTTSAAVSDYLSNPENRKVIADACPAHGGYWIYINLTAAAKSAPTHTEIADAADVAAPAAAA